jgi:hypothetical protein
MPSRREFLRVACQAALAGFSRASASSGPQLARSPYLQDVARDRAIVRWTTTEDCAAEVAVWNPSTAPYRVPATTSVLTPSVTGLDASYYEHSVVLSQLNEASEYRYQVLGAGQDLTPGGEARFRTPGTDRFSFLAFGDSGAGTAEQAALAELMAAESPDLVLHTGDLAYPAGCFESYEKRYFAVYRALMKRAPLFPCLGNHDYGLDDGAAYLAVHSLPAAGVRGEDRGRYYSFDWGVVHFVALDSGVPLAQAADGNVRMLEWLEADLGSTRQPWRIAFFHNPPYASGRHEGSLLYKLTQRLIAPILEHHGVQLVLNGHEHSYQRSLPLRNGGFAAPGEGTVYITTGGGGGGLYEAPPRPYLALTASEHHYVRVTIDGARLEAEAVKLSGELLDRVAIERA